jgi:hypothetical protein
MLSRPGGYFFPLSKDVSNPKAHYPVVFIGYSVDIKFHPTAFPKPFPAIIRAFVET